jgi:hypothetical protein
MREQKIRRLIGMDVMSVESRRWVWSLAVL